MSDKKVIQSDQIKKHTYKYVFEDLSYFIFDFVTFERRYYNKNDQVHREDGPAIVYANGDKSWYKNDQLHRENGPAIVYANGGKYWYKNDQFHREDGPAIVYANGDKYWYLDGEYYTEKLWKAELKRRSKNKYEEI